MPRWYGPKSTHVTATPCDVTTARYGFSAAPAGAASAAEASVRALVASCCNGSTDDDDDDDDDVDDDDDDDGGTSVHTRTVVSALALASSTPYSSLQGPIATAVMASAWSTTGSHSSGSAFGAALDAANTRTHSSAPPTASTVPWSSQHGPRAEHSTARVWRLCANRGLPHGTGASGNDDMANDADDDEDDDDDDDDGDGDDDGGNDDNGNAGGDGDGNNGGDDDDEGAGSGRPQCHSRTVRSSPQDTNSTPSSTTRLASDTLRTTPP